MTRNPYGTPGSCIYLSLAEARTIYERVSQETGISLNDLLSDSRERPIRVARWRVMRAMRDFGASVRQIATRMQMNPASVVNGLHKLETEEGRVSRAAQAMLQKHQRELESRY